jgi:uncharacterized protein (TIGR04255 family)
MSITKLINAPLKEVIFELHWQGEPDTSGLPVDSGFDLAQGKFADKLKDLYPLHKKLIPDGAPFKVFGAPIHQYWKGEFVWPVVQHGQGIIAINETGEGYEWEKIYKPLVLEAVKLLVSSYENVPEFKRMKLQYIDACDVEDLEPILFMKKNLQTSLETAYSHPGKLGNFNVSQVFELQDGSMMHLNISNGINNQNQKPSIIWTTIVEKAFSFNSNEIEPWLENAHSACSAIFKEMLNPEFYDSLDR